MPATRAEVGPIRERTSATRHNGQMIRHTVLFQLDEAAPLTEITTSLEALVGTIPGLLSVWAGIGSGTADTHTMALVTEHDDWAALDTYTIHPAHKAILAVVRQHLIDRAAVDVEL